MLTKSGKSVHKSVNKYANNWWKKNVQKCQKVSFTQIFEFYTEVLKNYLNNLFTFTNAYSYLLNNSFTHFPHRTTNTTTIFINNKETNF